MNIKMFLILKKGKKNVVKRQTFVDKTSISFYNGKCNVNGDKPEKKGRTY